MLISGDVIVRRGSTIVDILKPGASFGEIGFVVPDARAATITARDHVTVLKVRRSVTERTSMACQLKFERSFARSMGLRLAAAMRFIAKTNP